MLMELYNKRHRRNIVMKSLKKSLKNTNGNTQENYQNKAVWPGEAPPPYGQEGEKRFKKYMEREKKFAEQLK